MMTKAADLFKNVFENQTISATIRSAVNAVVHSSCACYSRILKVQWIKNPKDQTIAHLGPLFQGNPYLSLVGFHALIDLITEIYENDRKQYTSGEQHMV